MRFHMHIVSDLRNLRNRTPHHSSSCDVEGELTHQRRHPPPPFVPPYPRSRDRAIAPAADAASYRPASGPLRSRPRRGGGAEGTPVLLRAIRRHRAPSGTSLSGTSHLLAALAITRSVLSSAPLPRRSTPSLASTLAPPVRRLPLLSPIPWPCASDPPAAFSVNPRKGTALGRHRPGTPQSSHCRRSPSYCPDLRTASPSHCPARPHLPLPTALQTRASASTRTAASRSLPTTRATA